MESERSRFRFPQWTSRGGLEAILEPRHTLISLGLKGVGVDSDALGSQNCSRPFYPMRTTSTFNQTHAETLRVEQPPHQPTHQDFGARSVPAANKHRAKVHDAPLVQMPTSAAAKETAASELKTIHVFKAFPSTCPHQIVHCQTLKVKPQLNPTRTKTVGLGRVVANDQRNGLERPGATDAWSETSSEATPPRQCQ